jgi:tRNA dimethylallyltransferase
MPYNLVTVLGPTTSGKTRLSAQLANDCNGEIISADSRQVYKRMDIGTGKDLQDYKIGNSTVPYHLIDIIEPEREFNLFEFIRKFHDAFNVISKKNKLPFLVGGTGLYISSIIQNYNLKEVDFNSERAKELEKLEQENLKKILLSKKIKLHNKTDLSDKQRIVKSILISETGSQTYKPEHKINSLVIGISPSPGEVKQKISVRLKQRLENGMIEEVENLVKSGISFEKLDFFGLEYRYIGFYLKGELNYNDMFQKLNSAIHHFAKRQMTWFRKMEREGVIINWLDEPDLLKAKKIILENINV